MDKSTFLWPFSIVNCNSHYQRVLWSIGCPLNCWVSMAAQESWQDAMPHTKVAYLVPLVPHWYPIGTPLVPHWYPIGTPLVPHFGVPFWGDESNSRPTEEGRKYVHEARVMFRCQRCSHVEKMRGVASHAKPIGKIDWITVVRFHRFGENMGNIWRWAHVGHSTVLVSVACWSIWMFLGAPCCRHPFADGFGALRQRRVGAEAKSADNFGGCSRFFPKAAEVFW